MSCNDCVEKDRRVTELQRDLDHREKEYRILSDDHEALERERDEARAAQATAEQELAEERALTLYIFNGSVCMDNWRSFPQIREDRLMQFPAAARARKGDEQ